MALMSIPRELFMPALSVQQAVDRFNTVVEFVRTVMREGVDYGVIPGTEKPTLLKPGAEKLCTLFGLTSRFEIIRAVEDWTGQDHEGEPFFYYLYRCQLQRGDMTISEGDGSANSWEQKYRYREAKRRCPACNEAAIIRGKEEYGGGWVCFRKRGGCGAKFATDDPAITDQQAGRVPNENIADQVNTIQKIAQKRALIAATLLAVNGSEFFTQDAEEFIIHSERPGMGNPVEVVTTPVTGVRHGAQSGTGRALDDRKAEAASAVPTAREGRDWLEQLKQEEWLCTEAQKQMALRLLARLLETGISMAEVRDDLKGTHRVESPAGLAPNLAPRYITSLKQQLRARGQL
jgi:hypothetical protein